MSRDEREVRKPIRARPGTVMAILLLPAVAAVFLQGVAVVATVIVMLALCAWLVPATLRVIRSWRWWLLMTLLILPSALWVGEADLALGGLWLSQEGLNLGVEMACRATTIFLAVGALSQSVSVMQLTAALARVGQRDLGFAVGVGFHALPTLKRRFLAAYAALRMRGGFRKQRWRALQLLLITVIMGALRYGEDVVMAAEARAFQCSGQDFNRQDFNRQDFNRQDFNRQDLEADTSRSEV